MRGYVGKKPLVWAICVFCDKEINLGEGLGGQVKWRHSDGTPACPTTTYATPKEGTLRAP